MWNLILLSQREFEKLILKKKEIDKRLTEIRKVLANHEKLEFFDRAVFESIIDRVIVGGYNEDNSVDPYRLTFILKGDQTAVQEDVKNQYKLKNKSC